MDEPRSAGAPGAQSGFVRAWLLVVVLLGVGGLPVLDLLLLPWRADPEIAWVDAVWQRKAAMARLAGHGRVLIAGGSSGLFSVDAELLEARLGQPVCNIATHAGVRLASLLADAREVARPGDTVLLYLEYGHYSHEPLPLSEFERKYLWTCHPARLLRLPSAEAFRQIYGVPLQEYRLGWARQNASAPPDADRERGGYSQILFGPRGDYRATVANPQPPPPLTLRKPAFVRAGAAAELKAFFRWCVEHQVKVVAARPSTVRDPQASPAQVETAYSTVEPFYRQHQVPLLSTRPIFQMPAELFYDSSYHANAAGRRLISETLAQALAPVLGRPLRAADGPTLLIASPTSSPERDLALAGRPLAGCLFLARTDLHHPLCVTPSEVRQRCAAGAVMVVADPEGRALLQEAGLALAPLEKSAARLGDWVRAWPQHLLLLNQSGDFSTAAWWPDAPAPYRTFLERAGPKAAIFGTGAFSRIEQMRFGKASSAWSETPRARWQRAFAFPASFALSGGKSARAPIAIEQFAIVPAGAPGLAVAVYDPARGVVVRRALFTAPELLEWELQAVRLPESPHAL